MRIKTNDNVKVLKGKDRNKSGKVIQILPRDEKIVVEGLNIMYKNLRSQKSGEKGQRVEFSAPIAISNIRLICPKCKKTVRINYKILENGEKVRICNKCKELID